MLSGKYIKNFLLFLLALCCSFEIAGAESFRLFSPGGDLQLVVADNIPLKYSVYYKGRPILTDSELYLEIEGQGDKVLKIATHEIRNVRTVIRPLIGEKRAEIPDVYNELIIRFTDPIEVHFRIYDDGVAYRFVTGYKENVTIRGESAIFRFAENALLLCPFVSRRPDADIFHTSFEENYTLCRADTLQPEELTFTPVLVSPDQAPRILITESDVVDYPGMFLRGNPGGYLSAVFPAYPLEERVTGGEFRQKIVHRRAEYIAKTNGTRSFPWRVLGIAVTDADLLMNDLVYRLASEPGDLDFSFVKPGLSTEEWITSLNLYGVDFPAGLNTQTYKYYIDFAAEFGFEYVMLDAGWSDVNDLFRITPEMDMETISTYAQDKGIGLILWTQAMTLERQMDEAFEQFRKWDIKIVMTDFIDRNDQLAINFIQDVALRCAENGYMCMIHGAPVPAGFSRTWPNMVTREAVLGSEYNIWSARANPPHDLLIPFIRMAAGPMDYEPGILQHASREQTAKLGFEKVIAQGTRMHQLAMFVIFESPLQLFAGNLSDARREPELMHFLGEIPTVWDETRILQANLGKYILEARRKGATWYLAAMNSWDPVSFEVKTDFLGKGTYTVIKAEDGINAVRNPSDFRITRKNCVSGDSITIQLAPGGGFIARFTLQNP